MRIWYNVIMNWSVLDVMRDNEECWLVVNVKMDDILGYIMSYFLSCLILYKCVLSMVTSRE